jgi:hypothetical protein
MYCTGERAVTADQLKHCEPVLIANDSLAVDQAGANRQLAHGHSDERKARREIVSGASNQANARTIAPRQNAEAVVFDFVNPAEAAKRF